MWDGKVISAYLIILVLWALTPWLVWHHYLAPIIGGGIVIVWWIIAAYAGDKILLKSLRVEPLNVSRYKEIIEIVHNKKNNPKGTTPSLWVLGSMSPMLLTIGLSPNSSNLIFTKGFLEKLDDKTQLALITRELQAIRQGLTARSTAGATLLWFILLPGKAGSILTGSSPGEPNLLSMIMNIVAAPIGGIIARILFEKATVYDIDKQTSRMLDNPGYLPYALKEINEKLMLAPFNCELAVSECCAINHNSRDPYAAMYKMLPPAPKRIERLLQRAK